MITPEANGSPPSLSASAGFSVRTRAPDSDPAWKGADSKDLLARVMERVRAEGFRVGNADITIALQRPKIASYIEQMRQTLAPILGVPPERVSVKATTTERLGFVGRCEGCEVWATVLVCKA